MRAAGPQVWWWPNGRADRQRAVLFFPPSGAEPSSLRPLIEHTAGLRLGVAQLPGRGTRHDEPAASDMTVLIGELADAVRDLDGPPPILVGHSFGGLLAYGVVARLEDAGTPVGRLITVASASPPYWAAELRADRVRYPDDGRDGFVRRRTEKILADGGVPEELRRHPEFAARARDLVAADVTLSHHGFAVHALRTPVTAVVAGADTVLAPGACDGWAEVAQGGFTRVDVPGDHFFYRAAPQRLAAQLRMEIQSLDGEYELL